MYTEDRGVWAALCTVRRRSIINVHCRYRYTYILYINVYGEKNWEGKSRIHMYSYPQKKERNGKYTEEEMKGKVERSGIGAVRCSQNDTDEIGKKE